MMNSNPVSVAAYDIDHRVQRYDADMELLHPLRAEMVQVAVEMLPHARDAPLRLLELGVGTGFWTERFLSAFPAATVVGVEGARMMACSARDRLRTRERLTVVVADLRSIRDVVRTLGPFDVAFSGYTLHHLDLGEKGQIFETLRGLLRDGGWFVNGDIFLGETEVIEHRWQQLRVDQIIQRAARACDARFVDRHATRSYLGQLEREEGDRPCRLSGELALLRDAGFSDVGAWWQRHREAVYAGIAGGRLDTRTVKSGTG